MKTPIDQNSGVIDKILTKYEGGHSQKKSEAEKQRFISKTQKYKSQLMMKKTKIEKKEKPREKTQDVNPKKEIQSV